MITLFLVWPVGEPTASILETTFIPSTTDPNTTCFPSSLIYCLFEKNLKLYLQKKKNFIFYQVVLAVQIKNWDPFVLGPALAIERIPGPVCFKTKFSSSNFFPYIE